MIIFENSQVLIYFLYIGFAIRLFRDLLVEDVIRLRYLEFRQRAQLVNCNIEMIIYTYIFFTLYNIELHVKNIHNFVSNFSLYKNLRHLDIYVTVSFFVWVFHKRTSLNSLNAYLCALISLLANFPRNYVRWIYFKSILEQYFNFYNSFLYSVEALQ